MISDARGGHVSPGIYTEERDVTYSVKSLGITSLGAVGETLKGPAFQNIPIESWSEFVDYFGGTSTEKYKGNGRPKYELPYIAKAYLEESRRLNVVRVLGLSGYNAGPAWVLNTKTTGVPALVLRSKMAYDIPSENNYCEKGDDAAHAWVAKIEKTAYGETIYDANCVETPVSNATATAEYEAKYPYRFGLKVTLNVINTFTSMSEEEARAIGGDYFNNFEFVESLPSTVEKTNKEYYLVYTLKEENETEDSNSETNGLIKHVVSLTQFESYAFYKKTERGGEVYNYNVSLDSTDKRYIYNVLPKDPKSGDAYIYIDSVFEKNISLDADGLAENFVNIDGDSSEKYTNYAEGFRAAMTPWIVSNVDVNEKNATMRKLFRAITISDGNSANYQVKISIQRIDPAKGTFDLVVRDFYDSDTAPLILEKYSNCNMVEGDANYVAYKVGTSDGGYATKSKYITLEMAEGEGLEKCVPAGFLGYPSVFDSAITLDYNTEYNGYQKSRKQYFGLTPDTIETDILDYKGVEAYTYDNETEPKSISNGFHLDSILSVEDYVSVVDGISGYTFSTVSKAKASAGATRIPRIIAGTYMDDTIYKDINLRKFTVYPYGGFDGWDINREVRTNGDAYSSMNYNISGSTIFSKVSGEYIDMLNLPDTAITTDFYAYLGGYRQFANPEDVDINVFVTPGIDWVNNSILVDEALSIIEDADDGRGGDALYIIDSPQYDEDGTQIAAEDLARDLEDSGIDTSYGCTYFPWVKFFDTSNKKYIDLPVTKDVVRNMARTDNNSYPWFAPAGIDRGTVDCINAVKKTTLAEEDDLYEVGINPVKSFAQDGVKVWGNKTLYSADSPLNRINVRRLMIRVKKLIKDAARNLIFEQYDATLEKQFRNLVEPILTNVKDNRGISDYRLQIESTAETRDEHILPAKILIKPTPALEYISLSFVVYPESVEFED